MTDFDDILTHEIRRVIGGRQFAKAMDGTESCFDPLPLVGYLANYTLNLITIRLALSEDGFLFDETRFGATDRRPRVWDRLSYFWRSWFSVDALNGLNAVFNAERSDNSLRIRRSETLSFPAQGRRIEAELNVAIALGANAEIALGGIVMQDPLMRQSLSLDQARRAAEQDELGINDEILLRELWNAAIWRHDESTRDDLFRRCSEAVERNREPGIGKSIDLIRAFGALGDYGRFHQLVFELMRVTRSSLSSAMINADVFGALSELAANLEYHLPYPFLEQLSEEFAMGGERLSAQLSRLPANAAFSIGRQSLLRRHPMDGGTLEQLLGRSDSEAFLSTLSPRIAVDFLRVACRSRVQNLDPIIWQVLAYYLRPRAIFAMRADVSAEILDIAARPRFRRLLTGFCEWITVDITEYPPNRRRFFPHEPPYGPLEGHWIRRPDLSAKILNIVAKFGTAKLKKTLYEYALHRWLRPRRVRLNLSILRFSRDVDGAREFLTFVHNGPRNLFTHESHPSERGSVVTILFGRAIDNLRWTTSVRFGGSLKRLEIKTHYKNSLAF